MTVGELEGSSSERSQGQYNLRAIRGDVLKSDEGIINPTMAHDVMYGCRSGKKKMVGFGAASPGHQSI